MNIDQRGDAITAGDGTTIRYRTFGNGGPAVVLLHGGMQTSLNLLKLADLLSDRFTVHIPDRRGRGLSGPPGAGYGLETEIEDLRRLMRETGARNLFGLSSGAVIAIQAALRIPEIERIALYEPPLKFGTFSPIAWLPRYERELARGRKAAVFVTVMKGTADAPALRWVPHAVLVPLVKVGIRADGRASEVGGGGGGLPWRTSGRTRRTSRGGRSGRPLGYTPLGDLIPTMRQDATVVQQSAGPLDRFAALRAETLLLGGDKSAPYLKAVLNGLEAVVPHVRRVTLAGAGHLAADNSGKPQLVADQLRVFFY